MSVGLGGGMHGVWNEMANCARLLHDRNGKRETGRQETGNRLNY